MGASAVASVILKLCVFLKRCAHLAIGAEWEPSGVDTKTRTFGAPTIYGSYISLQECSHLAIGSEWEPSGAVTKTYVFYTSGVSKS